METLFGFMERLLPVKTYIIAEIGINHNGKIDIARRMIDKAKDAGVDAVKFQRRNPHKCYTKEELAKPCESIWGHTISDKVFGRELSFQDWDRIQRHCEDLSIDWSVSCYDWESFLLSEEFNLPWHKIASSMVLNERFVRGIAERRKLTLVSTGLLNWDGVFAVASVFEQAKCPYVLNHCVSLYPCPPQRLDLITIARMRNIFIEDETGPYRYCQAIGYSGHETGVPTTVAAVAFGAEYIERHFTLDRAMYGSDQAASLEPEGLRRLVKYIRTLEQSIGEGKKLLHGDEKRVITVDTDEWWYS